MPAVGKWSAEQNKQGVLDDPGCRWCNRAKRMNVRHDIVASPLFLGRGNLELLSIQVLFVYWLTSHILCAIQGDAPDFASSLQSLCLRWTDRAASLQWRARARACAKCGNGSMSGTLR
jgi:hypothetical protein